MATLEMVPLRRTLPTGRVTLRFAQPPINPTGDLAVLLQLELDAEAAAREARTTTGTTSTSTGSTTGTTPKVAVTAHRADPTGETSARKGGEAR
jgi:hypothetical protein